MRAPLRYEPTVPRASRLRVLPGIGGPLAPATVVGLSLSGHPLIKIETSLEHIDEASAFARMYLARRDAEGQR